MLLTEDQSGTESTLSYARTLAVTISELESRNRAAVLEHVVQLEDRDNLISDLKMQLESKEKDADECERDFEVGSMLVLLYGCIVVWLYGGTVVWLYCYMVVWLYVYMVIMVVWLYGCMVVWL